MQLAAETSSRAKPKPRARALLEHAELRPWELVAAVPGIEQEEAAIALQRQERDFVVLEIAAEILSELAEHCGEQWFAGFEMKRCGESKPWLESAIICELETLQQRVRVTAPRATLARVVQRLWPSTGIKEQSGVSLEAKFGYLLARWSSEVPLLRNLRLGEISSFHGSFVSQRSGADTAGETQVTLQLRERNQELGQLIFNF